MERKPKAKSWSQRGPQARRAWLTVRTSSEEHALLYRMAADDARRAGRRRVNLSGWMREILTAESRRRGLAPVSSSDAEPGRGDAPQRLPGA